MLLSVCRNVVNLVTRRKQCFPQFELSFSLRVKYQFTFQSSLFIFLADNRQKQKVSLEKCSSNTQTYALMSCYLCCVIMSHRVSWGGIESNTVVCNRRGNLSHEWDLAAFSRFLPFLELFAQQILVVQMWPEHSFNISPFEWSFPWPPSGFSIDF